MKGAISIMTRSNHSLEQLTTWFNRLIDILREQQSSTWILLVRAVAGKDAAIDFDGIQFRLWATADEPLQVWSQALSDPESIDFHITAETFRDVITGRTSLDAMVASGQIYVRGNLNDLMQIHMVTMGILADSAINSRLQRLWEEFDETWLCPQVPPDCQTLEAQIPPYGYLVRQVPKDVLNIEVE
jgi:hypothetical protein